MIITASERLCSLSLLDPLNMAKRHTVSHCAVLLCITFSYDIPIENSLCSQTDFVADICSRRLQLGHSEASFA